jgi:hemolysin III
MQSSPTQDQAEDRFSVLFFAIVIASSLSLLYTLVAYFAPNVWLGEIHASWLSLTTTFLVCHMASAFVEFFFHRYVLHAPVVPFFAYFYKQHTLHHSLTSIRPSRKDASVENRFPILEAKQHEASFFPAYALIVFSALATPLFVLVEWLLPGTPIFICGYGAIAWGLTLYELLHALEHKPIEKWQPFLEHPKYGAFWRKVYAFHLRHHADIHSNESISGFFGFPLPDLVFGTWVNPQTLYENKSAVDRGEFESPQPRFIGWLDRYARHKVQKRRQLTTA